MGNLKELCRIRIRDLAYAGGFTDGEGSVYITVGINNYLRIEVSCSQKYPEALKWFEKTFGGKVYGKFPSFQWKLNGENAVKYLKVVLPYLIVKNVDAQEAIAMWESKNNSDELLRLLEARKKRRDGRNAATC